MKAIPVVFKHDLMKVISIVFERALKDDWKNLHQVRSKTTKITFIRYAQR
jgi:hypothetical protein